VCSGFGIKHDSPPLFFQSIWGSNSAERFTVTVEKIGADSIGGGGL